MGRRFLAALVLAFAAGSATAAAGSSAAAPPSAPVAVLAYYDDLADLVAGLGRAAMPAEVPVYYGNYYGSPAKFKHRKRPPPPPVPSGRYAPIMPIRPSTFWHRRRLSQAERERLGPATEGRLAGRMPSRARLMHMSSARRIRWGQELGRRFRDRIRARRVVGMKIDAWQFDEVPSEVAGPRGRGPRQFTRAVLDGLTVGRAQLGDLAEPGIVWVAERAWPLAARPTDGERQRFWQALERASLWVVGEEYPPFAGSPWRAARAGAYGQRRLRAAGGVRAALAARYVVGMTPGNLLAPGYGGNVHHHAKGWVARWVRRYVSARAATGVKGFAEYHFRPPNARQSAIDRALGAMATGERALLARAGG